MSPTCDGGRISNVMDHKVVECSDVVRFVDCS